MLLSKPYGGRRAPMPIPVLMQFSSSIDVCILSNIIDRYTHRQTDKYRHYQIGGCTVQHTRVQVQAQFARTRVQHGGSKYTPLPPTNHAHYRSRYTPPPNHTGVNTPHSGSMGCRASLQCTPETGVGAREVGVGVNRVRFSQRLSRRETFEVRHDFRKKYC